MFGNEGEMSGYVRSQVSLTFSQGCSSSFYQSLSFVKFSFFSHLFLWIVIPRPLPNNTNNKKKQTKTPPIESHLPRKTDLQHIYIDPK
jgi:hypothetical protein